MDFADIKSPVKRERLKKQQLLKLKHDMRAALPVLTKEEIRRFRVPYYEAILLELNEQGFTSSEEFLKQLMQYQDDLRREHGPDSLVSSRPRLIECKEQLTILYNKLQSAEEAHYNNNIEKECDELIFLSIHFGLGSEDWWWLGEQILIQAVNVSSDFLKDGGKRSAMCKYIYGKFLLENLQDIQKAKDELTTARQLSIGKSWSAKKELNTKQDTIFVESCSLLYKTLLVEAKELMAYDPLKAARICATARKRAVNACDREGESEALILQGLCEMEAGDAALAVISFMKVLILYNKMQKIEGICEARIHIALANLKIGKYAETLKQLQTLLEFAEKQNLPYYVAQAHRFLGEYYLNQGTPSLATPLLIKALNIFHDLDDLLNSEQARNLAAISAGQELIPKYTELILKCGRPGLKGHSHVYRLVKWKDTRELFWTEGEEASTSSSIESFERSIMSLSYTAQLTEECTEEENEQDEEMTSITYSEQTDLDLSIKTSDDL